MSKLLNRILSKTSLSILTYHGITRSKLPVDDWCFISDMNFRKQLKYLRSHFHLTSLSDAVGLIETGSIREPTAVITFDDGFIGTYEFAFPVLRENGAPATIFLPTKFVDSDNTLWFCHLNQAFTMTHKTHLVWKRTTFRIDDPSRKAAVSHVLQEKLKDLPHHELTAEVEGIVRDLTAQNGGIGKPSPFRILNSDQISEMQESGLVEFGAHTHSHAILSRLSPEEQEQEIARSKVEVERLTGRPCRFFSYPNGRRKDYSRTTIHLIKSAGFTAAVTTIPGPNGKNTPLMELSRYDMGGTRPRLGLGPPYTIWLGAMKAIKGLWPIQVNTRQDNDRMDSRCHRPVRPRATGRIDPPLVWRPGEEPIYGTALFGDDRPVPRVHR